MLTRFRIEIFSVATFYLVQVLVLGVEGKGVVQESTEEIAARRARDLLQWTQELPAAPAPEPVAAPDRTWFALTECDKHCERCDRYGNCGACKEGYVPVKGEAGLVCACIDSDCYSCPDDPAVCTQCQDIAAEPDSAGKCVCREGFMYDDGAGMCLEREEVIWEEPAPEPVPERVPAPEPVPELVPVPEPVPELVPVPEPVPEPMPEPVPEPVPAPAPTPTRPTMPSTNFGDPICQDSLCSLCPEGTGSCQQCAKNASVDKNGECMCDAGFEEVMGINGSSGCLEVPALGDPTCVEGLCFSCAVEVEICQQCTKNASMGDTGVCVCDAGFEEVTSINGFGCMQTRDESDLSVRPQAGVSAREPERVTITPVLDEKIQALADKYGIVLGDRYESLVEKKQDVSEAIADAVATTAPAAAESIGNLGAAAANVATIPGDGFQYTNIRLESVTPDDFLGADAGTVPSQQAAYVNGMNSDDGARGTFKLRDWLANKLNKDDGLSNVPAAAPYVSGYVSGYDGAPQQPSAPLTPEESFREDLKNKKDLLMVLLKETDEAMRRQAEEQTAGADLGTQSLLDMLREVDAELERRIS